MTMPPIHPLIYTVREAAKALRMDDKRVYELVYTGELRSIQLNRTTRITHEALMDWLREQEAETDRRNGIVRGGQDAPTTRRARRLRSVGE